MKLLLAFAMVAGIFIRCSPPPKIQTEAQSYPQLYEFWTRQEMAAPFPATIPPDATKVKMASLSSVYANFFQVRMTLPEAEVARIWERADQEAKAKYDGGQAPRLEETPKDALPDAIFHTADAPPKTGLAPFPPDYRLFVLEARPLSAETEPKPWLHGQNAGIAISKKRREVVYFSQRW